MITFAIKGQSIHACQLAQIVKKVRENKYFFEDRGKSVNADYPIREISNSFQQRHMSWMNCCIEILFFTAIAKVASISNVGK